MEDSLEQMINDFLLDPLSNYSTTEINSGMLTRNSTLLDEDVASTLQSLEDLASIAYDPIFDFGVPGILLNAIGILGLFGNLISIIILSRPQMKSSINCILIGLASFDLILILTSILMFGLPSIYTYTVVTGCTPVFSTYYETIFPYIVGTLVYPAGLIAQTGSVYLTLCVTVERYVAVCHPLKAKSLCTYGRARVYVVLVGVFSLVYNLPRFWEISWKASEGNDKNTTEVQATTFRQNPLYIEVYINWMYFIFMYIIPFGFLAFFNILIYKEVRRANSTRAQLTRVQKREIGLAMMLICVVIIFFLCNSLALVVSILELTGKMFHPLTQTSNLLITINSSVNFIIYCIFGEKFKRIFLKICCAIIGRQGISRDMELIRYPDNSQYNNLRTLLPHTSTKISTIRRSECVKDNVTRTEINKDNLARDNITRTDFNKDNLVRYEFNNDNTARSEANKGNHIRKINNDLGGRNDCDYQYGPSSSHDIKSSQMNGSAPKCEEERISDENEKLLYPIGEHGGGDITITLMLQTCSNRHSEDCLCSHGHKDNFTAQTK